MFNIFTAIFLLSVAMPSVSESIPQRLFPDKISTKKNELNFQIIDSENLAIFTRANADYSDGKIYLVLLAQGELVNLKKIGFSDSRFKDSDPWLSPSGNELYFISNRPAFVGDVRKNHSDYDIWRSRKSGDDWLAPEHLQSINSQSGEFGPEINNGYLYFSSKKLGRYDIYRSLIIPDGLSKPEILPPPLNTEHHDSDFTLSKDGQVAIWWSQRPGGFGGGDLYVSRIVDGRWSDPKNLGAKVNTEHLDYTPSLSPNNAVFYYATNKPYPGQESGAADIYKLPVKNLPELHAAISMNAADKLKKAFGGHEALSDINQISYWIQIDSVKKGLKKRKIFIDFTNNAIAEYVPQENITRFVRDNQGIEIDGDKQRNLTSDERQKLLNTISYNFLYYLRAKDLQLIGPENITDHGDLNWFSLRTQSDESPLVGLDPITGRITKVLGNNGYVTLEMDYLKNDEGLIWPYTFIMNKSGEHILTGAFSELDTTPELFDKTPDWFSR